VAAAFAESPLLFGSTTARAFTINLEQTTLAVTSSADQALGTVSVSASLQEDGTAPVGGRALVFAIGSTTLTATTDATGTATVSTTLGDGRYAVSVSFAGDPYYQPASAAQTLIAYQPTRFVIWGGNPGGVIQGHDYTFWGSQWAKQVSGGDYRAGASFKGYADSVSGATWTSSGGNSSSPPATVPGFIGVLVTTQADKSGSTITGNVAGVEVLQVDDPAAYSADPGHSSTGVDVGSGSA